MTLVEARRIIWSRLATTCEHDARNVDWFEDYTELDAQRLVKASDQIAQLIRNRLMTKGDRPRGFAVMSQTKVTEIASKGGKAAHAAGTAHHFTSDEARQAGRKGGMAPHVHRGPKAKEEKSP